MLDCIITIQVESLQKLQAANQLAAEKLRKAVEEGGVLYRNLGVLCTCSCFSFLFFSLTRNARCNAEVVLGKIREALREICGSQFGINDEDDPHR